MTYIENRLLSLSLHISFNDSSVQSAVVVGLWSVGTLLT